MNEYHILDACEVDALTLNDFLASVYSSSKSTFIVENAAWLYRRQNNQWVVVNKNGQIVAYCAVIPTVCAVASELLSALWWVDLIVAPAFRGHGVQTLIDERIRSVADLKLGFPNKLAAVIHRKHGWGVREDGDILLLPLRPLAMPSIRRATGLRGIALRLMAVIVAPLLKGWQWRLRRYQPGTARRLPTIEPELLAAVFQRYYDPRTVTTHRDADYFRWRFGEAPYREELWVYVAGPISHPTHYLVARLLKQNPAPVLRVLDFYGDFTDLASMRDILWLAVYDAITQEAAQVTIMSFIAAFSGWLRRSGFVLRAVGRFCWHSETDETMRAFSAPQYWTLADSDNDAP